LSDESKSWKAFLLRGGSWSLVIQVSAMGAVFAAQILLARFLGKTEYGAFAYMLSWIAILRVPAIFGFDRLLIRNVASYQYKNQWSLLKGLLRRADHLIIGISIVSCALVAAFAPIERRLWVGFLIVPLTSLTIARQSALHGLFRVISGKLAENLGRPLAFIAFILLAHVFWTGGLDAGMALQLNALAFFLAFGANSLLLHKALPAQAKTAAPAYETASWIKAALPMALISEMIILNDNLDIIMLGAIRGTENAGVYSIATRGAGLITLLLTAMNTVMGPMISRIYAAGEIKRMERTLIRITRTLTALSLPVALGLMVFGNFFLLIFGQGFQEGWTALVILSAARLVNVAMGPVGLLLVMSGHEKDSAVLVGLSCLLNAVLNALFIPRYGMNGAAMATATSMVLWNVLLSIAVFRRLNILTSVFGRFTIGPDK